MKMNPTQRSTLMVTSLAYFMGPFMLSAVHITLPAMQQTYHAHAVLLGWIATSYLLSTAVFLVPMGKVGDIYGRKKIFGGGVLLFALTSLLCAFSPNVQLLIFFRALQGIGGAMFMTTAMAILASVFPPEQRGRAIGILVSMVYIGLSAGPFLGGILTQHFGWRSVFLVNAPMGFLTFLMIRFGIRDEWADAQGERLDIAGSLWYGSALILLIYGATRLPEAVGVGLMLLGLAGAVFFVRHELHCPHPVFEVRLFTDNRVFTFSSLAALINYSATYALTFLVSLYLQYIKALPPQTAGLLLVAQPLTQAFISPFAGRLSDRIEPFRIASLGMSITAVGLAACIFLDTHTPLPLIVGLLILMGAGFGLFSSPNMNAIMGSVPPRLYGIASGAVATMRLLGQMISMTIATLVFALVIGPREIQPATYPLFLRSVQVIFTILCFLCLIGIYFSLKRGRMRHHTV